MSAPSLQEAAKAMLVLAVNLDSAHIGVVEGKTFDLQSQNVRQPAQLGAFDGFGVLLTRLTLVAVVTLWVLMNPYRLWQLEQAQLRTSSLSAFMYISRLSWMDARLTSLP
jgi:hypothetical protein